MASCFLSRSAWTSAVALLTGGLIAAGFLATVGAQVNENLRDFGDAPDSYLTSLSAEGARHVVAGPRIGTGVDDEADAIVPLDGTGDDIAEDPDDEDGITVATFSEGVESSVSIDVQNVTATTNIVVFVDWDGDGTFTNGPPERFDASTAADATVDVPVTPPDGSAAANCGLTFVRVRVSTAEPAAILPGGELPDGEVEDVFVPIQAPSLATPSVRFLDDIRVGRTRRVASMGTSLTAASFWLSPLETWLQEEALDPSNVSVVTHAQSGKSSAHGVAVQLPELKATLPRADVVFIEFAINDASLGTGVSLQESKDNLNFIIDDLMLFNPDIEIVLMTMSNTIDAPSSANASARPELYKYYQGYRDVAAQRNLLLIDHYPNWINLFNSDLPTWKSYMPDSIHPNKAGSDNVIVPEIKRALDAASMKVIDKEIPLITWDAPAAITYGTALGGTQLNAVANVAGTLSYSPASGTILDAGIHTLTTTFEPIDTARYVSATQTVTLIVNKATPTISWSAPAAITFGTALSGAQLNATSSEPGILAYTPPIGTVLDAGTGQQLMATLPESANHSQASAIVTIDVDPALLTVTADNKQRGAGLLNPPLTATYSGFVNGETAPATPPTLSTTAEISSSPGAYPITITGGGDTNYVFNYANGTLTVTDKEIPIITWGAPASIEFGTALDSAQLNATANVAGTFSYSPTSGTVLSAGLRTLSVTFTPSDSARYATTSETVVLTVDKAAPSITWNQPAAITYGTSLSGTQLDATTSASGVLNYAPAAGTILGVGTDQQLQVSLTESANYFGASATVTIDVLPAPLVITADDKQRGAGSPNPPLTARYSGLVNGDTSIGTPPTLSTNADISSAPGAYPISVTGGGDPNYSLSYINGTLTVSNRLVPEITWNSPTAITFGSALDGTQLNATASVAGTFSYSPTNGTVPDAGLHTLTASFTPADAITYASVSETVTLIVNKATPTITWSSPSAITYGTSLSTTQLNATTSAPGTLHYSPAGGTVLNVGNFQQLLVSLPESANYLGSSGLVTIDVDPAPLTVTADDKQRGAGLTNPPLTASYSGFVYGDAVPATLPTLSTTADSSSAPGSYPITVSGGGDPNYALSYVDGTLTVADRESPMITWSDPAAITFGTSLDGTQLNATANVAGTFSYAPIAGTVLDAGFHTLTATFTPTDAVTYASTSATATLIVDKATPTINWSAPAAITYGTGLGGTQLNASTAAPGTLGYTPPTGTILNVGTAQQLSVALPESANYLAANAMVTIDVDPAPLTITADDKQREVGQANPPLTASYSGFVNGDSAIATPPTLSTTADGSSVAGSYPITVTGGSDPSYAVSRVDGTLTVTAQQVPTITWSNPATITFGTALDGTQLNATASVPGTFTYSPAGGTVLDAASHTLTASFTPNNTVIYASVSATVTLLVEKATPSITWTNPAAIIYGSALGATQLNATTGAPGTLAYTPPTGTILNAGTAQPLQATLPESANYLTANAMVTIDVNPAPLTITADDKQRGPGLANPPLTATYSGFVNGDTAVAVAPTLATSADSSSAPGGYPITVTGGSDPNYALSLVDGTLTVSNKEVPVITWNDPAAITFGTLLDGTQLNASASVAGTFAYSPASGTELGAGSHVLTATFTPTDTVTYATTNATVTIAVNKATPTITWTNPAAITYGTALGATQLNATTSAPGTLNYTPAAGTALNVGTAQPLQATLPESANYLTANAMVTIDVNPAPLTITADDKQRGPGLANPPLTATYSGFVNGDTAVAVAPTLATSADSSSAPGGYPITVTGGSDPNYALSLVDGTLTVSNKEVPVITWNDPAAITFGTLLDGTQLNASASVAGTFAYSPASGTELGAGSHVLTATFTPTDTVTYATTNATVTIAVNKATPTITWTNPAAIIYGTALGATQLNATTSAPGTLNYTPAAGTALNVGTAQPLQATLPESANYLTANAMVTIDVNPAPLTITADDKRRGPGLANPPLTATYSGFVNGDEEITVAPTLSTTADNSSAPGSYPITVTGGSDSNYALSLVDGTLTVSNKEVPEITWNDPVAITFGTLLDGTQLNASANVAGTFAYSPASGTELGAGSHVLTATFTPTDTVTYATTDATVTIVVNKATPTITWDVPASITYGTALDETQLNATTSEPGILIYTPPTGTVLDVGSAQQLQVSLPESANYSGASANVTIDVAPAPLTVTADDKQRAAGFENPPLTASYSGIVNGDTVIDTPPTLSTTAEISSAPGFYPIMVTGGSDPNYSFIRLNGTLAVAAKEIPEITWNAPAPITFGAALAGAQLNATANVPGTFSYVPGSGTELHAGTHTLTAFFTPTDTARYASPSATVEITVNKATPMITWNAPAPITYGTGLSSAQLNATTTAPGSFTYTPPDGTVLDAGTGQQLQVDLPESANYVAASTSVLIDIAPAPLTITADDKQRGAGLANPPLTANYSGFVNGDTAITTPPALSTTAQISSPPGDYPIIVTGGSDSNYAISRVNGILTVADKEIPIITWDDPAAITFGTALGPEQLNATANVAGTFSYSLDSGTLLGAGVHSITATFAPTDTARYASASKTVTLTVNKATPVIAWETPDPITFGTPLSDTQLNASANVAGNLSYTPAAGETLNAGTHTLSVEFTPSDVANYAAVTKAVSIVVNKALPLITWDEPDAVSFGQALDETQLNASADVPGTFVYTPADGEVLDAGTHTLATEFTPEDTANYSLASRSVPFTVNKAIPTISWNPAGIRFGTPLGAGQLNATANVAGSFSYTPIAGTILNAGTPRLTVDFSPTDTSNYEPATNSVLLVVNKAIPNITWNTPAPIIYGTALGTAQLNAAADAPGTLAYTPEVGTVLNAGDAQPLQVVLPESDNYVKASAETTIDVQPAPLIITAEDKQRRAGLDNPPLTASYSGFVNGDTAITTLPTLSTTANTSSAPGNYPITVTGGSDPNYSISRVNGTLTVADKEIPVITWNNPEPIIFGTALDGSHLNATVNVAGSFSYAPAIGTVLNSSTHTLTVTFTPTDSARFATATKTVTITVNKASPTITWNDPTTITYGTALSAVQLNAAADAPGTLAYTPAAGTVLNAGNGQLLEVLLPESSNYTEASATVTIEVIPAPLTITADDKQRSAGLDNPLLTASYTGFVNGDTAPATLPSLATTAEKSSPPGNYTITVTGGNDPNYTISYVNGTLTISDKEVPVINWETPAAITSDTPLGDEQLNASVSGIPGSFAYTPPAGTTLEVGPHTLTTIFTPQDLARYATVTATVTITVNAGTSPWQNPENPADVFADGRLDVRDVSVVIILMNSPVTNDQTYPDAGLFPDVDGDRAVTVLDVEAVAGMLPTEVVESILRANQMPFAKRPQIHSVGHGPNGFTLSFSGEPGVTYDLQYAEEQAAPPQQSLAWRIVKSGLSGQISVSDDDPVRSARRSGFYRITGQLGKGDFDGNGGFGAEDIDILAGAIREGKTTLIYDLNEDRRVTALDLEFLVEDSSKLNTRLGDLNLDGSVDLTDVFAWLPAFGEQNTGWSTGDFDGDGMTTGSDFGILAQNFGAIRLSSPDPGAAPWQNQARHEDVDGNGVVNASDLTATIARLDLLEKLGSGAAPLPAPAGGNLPPPFIDVNGDGALSNNDAVRVNLILNSE